MKNFKKVLFIFLIICTSVTLFSFNYKKTENTYLTEEELVINDGLLKRFSYDNANFYNLVGSDNSNYGYRIIFDGYLETFIEMTLGDTKLLRGILDNNSFSISIDKPILDLLIAKCEDNKIIEEDNFWWDLYEIRDDYYKKTYKPSFLMPNATYVSDYELEKMTDNDYYLNNYELRKYGGPAVKKYEDEIVNIIPKDWFFDVGVHTYYGKEYIIYTDTVLINDGSVWKNTYWKTDVYVFDIDITKIGASQVEEPKPNDQPKDLVANVGYNIIIDVAIRNVYYGLDYEQSQGFYVDCNLDQTKSRIVVNGKAIGFFDIYPDRPSPIFLNVENLYTSIEAPSILESEYSIEHIMYKLNNKSNSYKASVSGEKQCMDRYLNEEVALTALGIILGKYGIVLDILNIVGQGFDYIYSPAEVSNNYSGYERDILVSNVNEDYKCSLMALPNNINSLIANQVYDYSYKIGIDIPFESVSTTNVNERKVYYKSAFNVQLFDVNGDIISNGEHSYEYDGSPYLETNKYGKTIGLPYKANILASDEEDNNMFRVKESGTVIIETAVNTYVSVADIYGRVMASSKNPYGKSQYVITYLEKDKYYYVITGYNMPNTGEYNISFKTNISYLTDNSTTYIRNSNDSVSLIYKYRPNNVPIGIDVFTNSYQDTNIAIYTEKGQFLNGNDDYYYDPDSDFSDYNASCQIGITTNIDYYIVINSYKVNNLDDEIVIKVVTF